MHSSRVAVTSTGWLPPFSIVMWYGMSSSTQNPVFGSTSVATTVPEIQLKQQPAVLQTCMSTGSWSLDKDTSTSSLMVSHISVWTWISSWMSPIHIRVGLDKICFFSAYFAFLLCSINLPILLFPFTHFALSFTHFAFQKFLFCIL